MPNRLSNFMIAGLHGRRETISLPIEDNQLILVGENDTGKSTVANLFYYLLSQQWHRIAEYVFESLTVQVSGGLVSLTREDVDTLDANRRGPFGREISRAFPPSILRQA